MEAQRILAERYGVAADAWAVTSWTQPAHRRARGGALEPAAPRRRAACRRHHRGARARDPTPWSPSPTTCARVPDQVARFVDRPYMSLGTDGFGRSDARDGAALLLRGRRGAPGRGRAAAAGARRARRAGGGGRGDRRARHRPRRDAPAPVHDGVSSGHEAWPAPPPAPSGTLSDSVRAVRPERRAATSKKGQHCFSRWAERPPRPRARHPSRRAPGAPTVASALDRDDRRRHERAPLVHPLRQRPGVEAAGDRGRRLVARRHRVGCHRARRG